MEWKLDGILPLYFKDESFPRKTNGEEILTQVENIVGKKAKRCLKYGKTWMVYVNDNESRLKVIRVGLTIQGKKIQAFDRNPYILLDKYGNEIKTTKLVVSHIPPTFDSDEIVAYLVEKGVAFHSKFMKEMMFLKDGTIHPRWETGNLFAYIEVPSKPLPSHITVGKFKIKLRHREQIEDIVCNNCFQKGHYAKYCKNEVVCIDCQKSGHKRGDAKCSILENPEDKDADDDGDDYVDEDENTQDKEEDEDSDEKEEKDEDGDEEGKDDLDENDKNGDEEKKEDLKEQDDKIHIEVLRNSNEDSDNKQNIESSSNTSNDEIVYSSQNVEKKNEQNKQLINADTLNKNQNSSIVQNRDCPKNNIKYCEK